MKELIDFKQIWQWCASKWGKSFGCIVLMLLSFLFGQAFTERDITNDCKFMGAFRDGPQAYNCNPRVK